MATINKDLMRYTEIIESKAFDYDITKPPKKTIRKFIKLLSSVDDPRVQGRTSYPLMEIIVIAFLAVLSGASNWHDIERFGVAKIKWLRRLLPLQHGIPSHDTFRRTFGLFMPTQLQKATVQFMTDIFKKLKKHIVYSEQDEVYRLIAVDGKTARSTGRKHNTDEEIRNLQALNIYDISSGLIISSEMINEKTNEIPVAQNLLSQMNLKKCIITFDAMNTQKKTTRIICGQMGDYVGGLKENHQDLYNEIKGYITRNPLEKLKGNPDKYFAFPLEKAHNQEEKREYYLLNIKNFFIDEKDDDEEKWVGLRNVVCYVKTITNKKEDKICETRYYLTSLNNIKLCAEAIRGHWAIENNLHWHLDTTFNEDENTTMDKVAYNNLSLLNKMSLSLLKLAKPVFKQSLSGIKKMIGWESTEVLSKILNYLSSEEIQEALQEKANK